MQIISTLAIVCYIGLAGSLTATHAAERPLVWAESLPPTLDPHARFDVPIQTIMVNVYDALYRYTGNPPKLVPWLAESHTTSDDGLTWEFRIKPGLKFHDGSDMTAADVVYSFQRLLKMGKGPSSVFRGVLLPENVKAVDDRTVRFKLEAPYAPFLSTMPLVSIVNPRQIEKHVKDGDFGEAWLSANDAGSGPYKVNPETYQQRVRLDLVRFKDHFMGWDHNSKPMENVSLRPVQDPSTRVLALLRGEIDATGAYLPTDQVERIDKSKNANVSRDETMRIFLFRMNNKKPPFDNVHVRRCLSHAFDYDGFNKIVLKGFVERNPGPIPNGLWGIPEDIKGYTYDLEKAKAECDKARAQGADLDREFEIHTLAELEQTVQAAQLFQSALTKLGLKVRIVPGTWPVLSAAAAKPDTAPELWVFWISTYFVDPENWIGQMYDTSFHGTWKASAFYDNPEVDKLLRAARRETDQSKRAELYKQAYRIIYKDAADIWIYNTIQLRGLSNRVKGYQFTPVGSGSDFRSISLKD
ncbi:MAG: ABC transporter substrate-binding protein [Hyphomicrobiaceae bacterium]|nr:ABC transporter substrate-binding protein [Hyphomicrobiaceae bacterium]